LFFNPLQDWLIQLVGLRGAVFFLPFLLAGAYLTAEDLKTIATGLAFLSIAELGVALFEYLGGLERVFPRNIVTQIIYSSNDVAGHTLRIPATFANAASYGGTMVLIIPILAAVWAGGNVGPWRRRILEAGIAASAVGIFLCACRTPVIFLLCLGVLAPFTVRLKASQRTALLILSVLVAGIVISNDRMQRFLTLSDTTFVQKRVNQSVNASFADILLEYPMGNGLGAGGTSIPYFLQERLRHGLLIENEYGRMVIEQGIIGLVIWAAFIIWFLCRAWPAGRGNWDLGRRMCWVAAACSFADGCLGIGVLTAIPGTPILLLICGWLIGINREPTKRSNTAYRPRLIVSTHPVLTEEISV
jgi:hypothetical protein